MGQRTTGWRTALSSAPVYQGVQDLLGGRGARDAIVERFVRPAAGARVLDIGCGTGSILASMPAVDYVGLDLSEEYVAAARRQWGGRGTFVQGDLRDAPALEGRRFDRVLALGVLHHLTDAEADGLLDVAGRHLSDHGVLVTVDPARTPGQHPVARWLIGRDRGQHVRAPDQYAALARQRFSRVTSATCRDLLKVPYTHGIVTASAPREAAGSSTGRATTTTSPNATGGGRRA